MRIQDIDIREAEERIRRYDRNNDASLDQEELNSGRWNDNPMQYDRNRDGKLQSNELAVRYAKRRQDDAQGNANGESENNDDRRARWATGAAEKLQLNRTLRQPSSPKLLGRIAPAIESMRRRKAETQSKVFRHGSLQRTPIRMVSLQ